MEEWTLQSAVSQHCRETNRHLELTGRVSFQQLTFYFLQVLFFKGFLNLFERERRASEREHEWGGGSDGEGEAGSR